MVVGPVAAIGILVLCTFAVTALAVVLVGVTLND